MHYNIAIQRNAQYQGLYSEVVGITTARNCSFKVIDDVIPDDYTPFGTVEWTQERLGRIVYPNYYPDFLSRFISRKIKKVKKEDLDVFVKPADKYKQFESFKVFDREGNPNLKKEKIEEVWVSQIVSFEQEWRYYIINGEVLTCGWYASNTLNQDPPPPIGSYFPSDYCGAVDFGRLDNELELVEAHDPFACGFYGPKKDIDKYLEFVTAGWDYLKNKKDLKFKL